MAIKVEFTLLSFWCDRIYDRRRVCSEGVSLFPIPTPPSLSLILSILVAVAIELEFFLVKPFLFVTNHNNKHTEKFCSKL